MTKAICSTEGCDSPVKARGLCAKHYYADRYRRLGGSQNPKRVAHRAANSERHKEWSAAWYSANKERHAANRKAWTTENSAKKRALDKAWRSANRDRRRQQSKAWREANRERARMIQRQAEARRRAQKRSSETEPVDFAAILEEHGMFCHICSLVIVDLSDLHFDHVIPLAKGGTHTADNIRPSHALCNWRKGDKTA